MNHASLGFFFKSRSKDQNWISFGHARRAADKIGKYRAYGEMWECACEGNAVISTTHAAGLSVSFQHRCLRSVCSAISNRKQLLRCRRGPIDYANLYFIIEHVASSINKYDACCIIFSAG